MPVYYTSRVIRGVEERYPSYGEARIHPNYGRLQAKGVLIVVLTVKSLGKKK